MKALLPALFLAIVSVTAVFAKGGPAINDKCPVDGKAVRIIYRVFTDKGTVAFCCVDCMDTYQKNPARYTVTPKTPEQVIAGHHETPLASAGRFRFESPHV